MSFDKLRDELSISHEANEVRQVVYNLKGRYYTDTAMRNAISKEEIVRMGHPVITFTKH